VGCSTRRKGCGSVKKRGDRIGMFDTKTVQFKEWPAPTPGSWPYDVTADKNGEAWSGGEFTDTVQRLNPTTGEFVEYLLPRFTNIRRVFVDNSTTPVTFSPGSTAAESGRPPGPAAGPDQLLDSGRRTPGRRRPARKLSAPSRPCAQRLLYGHPVSRRERPEGEPDHVAPPPATDAVNKTKRVHLKSTMTRSRLEGYGCPHLTVGDWHDQPFSGLNRAPGSIPQNLNQPTPLVKRNFFD
jgi:hypothetical protein